MFGRRGGAAARRGTPADLLVVGLANPGAEYAGTRHNVGAEVVELLAERHGGQAASAARSGPSSTRCGWAACALALAIPQTYMNLSGESVAPLVRRHGITDPHRLVIVHDELDLPVGRIKVKVGGGLAGNNGLKSVKAHLHTDDFVRIRIGIGKPPGRAEGGGPRACKRRASRIAPSSTSRWSRRPTPWSSSSPTASTPP